MQCVYSSQKTMGRPRKRQRQESPKQSTSGQAVGSISLSDLDIDLNDQQLPSYHDWTMPSFDMPADFSDGVNASWPEEPANAAPFESRPQHDEVEFTPYVGAIGPMAHFWNTDYSSVSIDATTQGSTALKPSLAQ